MSRIELAYARQDLAPDFMLKGTYKDMEMSQDYWALMVGLTLPVAPWSGAKYLSKVRQGELLIKKSENEYASQENMVAADLRTTLAKISTGKRQLELYRNDLVPQAEQTLRSTISATRPARPRSSCDRRLPDGADGQSRLRHDPDELHVQPGRARKYRGLEPGGDKTGRGKITQRER